MIWVVYEEFIDYRGYAIKVFPMGYFMDELDAKEFCEAEMNRHRKLSTIYNTIMEEKRERFSNITLPYWKTLERPRWQPGLSDDLITDEMRTERNRYNALNERIEERNTRIAKRAKEVKDKMVMGLIDDLENCDESEKETLREWYDEDICGMGPDFGKEEILLKHAPLENLKK